MAAITATSTSNTDSSDSPDVRPFPAPYLIPAGTTTSADFCPVSPHLAVRAAGAAARQHNQHPGRPPRIRTTTFPLRPPRLRVTTLSVMTGFTFLSRLTQIAPPCTRFVFLGAGFRLGLPSHPASRRRSCLRLGVSTTSSSRGLSPPSDRPCRAYSRRCLRRRWPDVSAGLCLGRPARRTPGHTRWHTDRTGSFAAQTGAALSRVPRAPASRSKLPRLGRAARKERGRTRSRSPALR